MASSLSNIGSQFWGYALKASVPMALSIWERNARTLVFLAHYQALDQTAKILDRVVAPYFSETTPQAKKYISLLVATFLIVRTSSLLGYSGKEAYLVLSAKIFLSQMPSITCLQCGGSLHSDELLESS